MNEAHANRTVIDLGRSIAHACIRDRFEQEVTLPFSLLTLENYSANRPTPRPIVRDQFKVVDLSQREPGYCYEMNSEEVVDAVEGVDALPEFQRAFGYAEPVNLYPTCAWIGAHEAMLSDTGALPSFVATRLVPRPFTAENHSLLSRPHGLLNMPSITNVERVSRHPRICALEAFNTVEQGAAGGGMLLKPRDCRTLVQTSDTVRKLELSGTRITRTRLAPGNQGIEGEFDLGTRLFEAACATVKIGEAGKATDGNRIYRIEASFKERLVKLSIAVVKFEIRLIGTTEEHRNVFFYYGVLMAGGAVIALQNNAFMLQLAAVCFGLTFYAVYGLIPAAISKAMPENATSIFAIATVLLGFGTTFGKFTGGLSSKQRRSFPRYLPWCRGIAALAICIMLILPAER
ncbi:family 3 encapsulin nanocompartment shell protein [Ensifer sp. BR816]|uniref:family 3 encapsulin nanocompartment shell protein n=1 Tax=Rhizobium sp. (strain BR816) TaxID=1057002 RepID=UPI00035EA493|nr:family 3 encapsulin nanocompartment shell protein [Ensifer sp. BR816]